MAAGQRRGTRGHGNAAADLVIIQQLGMASGLLAAVAAGRTTPLLTHSGPSSAEGAHSAAAAVLQLQGKITGRQMSLMLDSGATENFISASVAAELGLSILPTLRTARTASGELIRMLGHVKTSFTVALEKAQSCDRASERTFNASFLVMEMPGYDAILGQPWLRAEGVQIAFDSSPPTVECGGSGAAWGKRARLALAGRPENSDRPAGGSAAAAVQALPKTAMPRLSAADIQRCAIERAASLERHRTALLQDDQELPAHLPPVRAVQHRIDLKPDAWRRTKARPLRLAVDEKAEINKQVALMLKQGLIRESKSSYSSTPMLVRKKDGKLRLVFDYRGINYLTIPDNYPMPLPDVLFDRTQGARVFSTIDLKNGFYQIRLERPEDCALTAFITDTGLYEFVVLPMGLCNAPATFMRLMHHVFAKEIAAGFVIVYLDDILIYSETVDEHVKHVEAVFARLREAQLYAKASKCNLFQEAVSFLGHRLGADHIGTSADKVEAITNWPEPTTVTEVRSFCGAVGYYRDFIPHCSELMQPLTALTGSRTPWKWGQQERDAFTALKAALATQPVLRLPDRNRPFVVCTDASKVAVGAVLQQRATDTAPLQPVAFFSHRLSAAQSNYSVREQELLAIILALEHWRHYLIGRRFTVETDHQSLRHIWTSNKLLGREARWIERLADYHFVIRYVRGETNVVADSLSRLGYNRLNDDKDRSEPESEPAAADSSSLPLPSSLQERRHTARHALWASRPYAQGERIATYTGDHITGGAAESDQFVIGYSPEEALAAAVSSLDAAAPTVVRAVADARYASCANANARFCIDLQQHIACLKATRPILRGEEVRVPFAADYWRHTGAEAAARVTGLALLSSISVEEASGGGGNSLTSSGQLLEDQQLARLPPPAPSPISLLSLTLGDTHWDIAGELRAAAAADTDYRSRLASSTRGPGVRVNEGLLWYKGRCLVPNSSGLRERIMRELHEVPAAGHLGRDKTLAAVKQRFVWTGLDAAVRSFVESCDICQRTKLSQERPAGLLMPLPVPAQPWESFSMDLITKLPQTSTGYDSIIVFVDRFSKAMHCAPCKEAMDAAAMVELVMTNVIRIHGPPVSIVSDRVMHVAKQITLFLYPRTHPRFSSCCCGHF